MNRLSVLTRTENCLLLTIEFGGRRVKGKLTNMPHAKFSILSGVLICTTANLCLSKCSTQPDGRPEF